MNDGARARQFASDISGALAEIVARAVPGGVLIGVEPLAPDSAGSNRTAKAVGYGEPLRLRVRDATGAESMLVFHTAHPDVFGHDRRADRAAEMLLSYDRFPLIPGHSRALDVGALRKDGRGLISLRDAGEFYLLTTFASGHVYADELRRIVQRGALDDSDLAHADQLVRHLIEVHSEKSENPAAYTRFVRDVLGSGEGIFGMIDGYPEGVPGASRARLQGIERRCLEWRWRLRGQEHRLSRTHGDYHPFNIVFDDTSALTLLDSSRGSCGDPADDVTCLAINYVFFAIERPELWRTAFRELWTRFWRTYLAGSGDRELLGVAAPFLAWRGLVVCNPLWYPHVGGPERDRMLTLIERALDEKAFDPGLADEVFA